MNFKQSFEASLLEQRNTFDEKIEMILDFNSELREEIDNLYDSEIPLIKNRIKTLEYEHYDLSQYIRRPTIEISGVPSNVPQEHLESHMIDLLGHIGLYITPKAIVACHRLKNRNYRQPANVVVRFVNRKHAVFAIKNRFRLKHHRDLKRIYIYDNLCPQYRRIFDKLNDLKNDGFINHVWSYNGKVSFKKSTNRYARGTRVSHIEDLDSLLNDARLHRLALEEEREIAARAPVDYPAVQQSDHVGDIAQIAYESVDVASGDAAAPSNASPRAEVLNLPPMSALEEVDEPAESMVSPPSPLVIQVEQSISVPEVTDADHTLHATSFAPDNTIFAAGTRPSVSNNCDTSSVPTDIVFINAAFERFNDNASNEISVIQPNNLQSIQVSSPDKMEMLMETVPTDNKLLNSSCADPESLRIIETHNISIIAGAEPDNDPLIIDTSPELLEISPDITLTASTEAASVSVSVPTTAVLSSTSSQNPNCDHLNMPGVATIEHDVEPTVVTSPPGGIEITDAKFLNSTSAEPDAPVSVVTPNISVIDGPESVISHLSPTGTSPKFLATSPNCTNSAITEPVSFSNTAISTSKSSLNLSIDKLNMPDIAITEHVVVPTEAITPPESIKETYIDPKPECSSESTVQAPYCSNDPASDEPVVSVGVIVTKPESSTIDRINETIMARSQTDIEFPAVAVSPESNNGPDDVFAIVDSSQDSSSFTIPTAEEVAAMTNSFASFCTEYSKK